MASPTWRQVHDTIRWVPFVFINSIVLFGLAVLVNLHISYTMFHRRLYVSSVINILVSCLLAGMALWSFLVAVFKSPGHPPGVLPDQQVWDRRDAGGSRGERRQRLREEQIGLTDDLEDDVGSDDEEHGQENVSDDLSQEEPLLRRRTDPTTDAFDAGAGLLPGQPKMPARTGRAQLDDVMTVVEQSKQQRNDGRIYLSGLQVKNTGGRRWCKQCNCQKPDRAHHCSTCGVCILRMDHHCPWLASKCIGLRNHKAFFLFLFYTGLFCCYAAQDTGRALIHYVEEEVNGYQTSPITWAIVMFLGLIFGLALIPFSAYHAYLICRNRTTLESMEGAGRVRISVPRSSSLPPRESVSDRLRRLARTNGSSDDSTALRTGASQHGDAWKRDEELTREERKTLRKANKLNIYDVGARRNWCSVMGDRWPQWWIPVGNPESDGHIYEVNPHTLQRLEEITAAVRDMREGRFEGTADGRPTNDDHQARVSDAPTSTPVSSIRSKARSSLNDFSTGDQTSGKLPTPGAMTHSPPARRKTGHGLAEWGAPPKRDFVMYGLGDDDAESGGVLGRASPLPESNDGRSTTTPASQMDAEVWSS